MKAMILAAGRGTRMAPLTDNCPKPLIPLAGKPLIEHHIEKLVAAGVRDIVINHAYLGFMIEDALGDGSRWSCSIRYSAEDQALETAGGIIKALPLLATESNEPFLLINGDVWLDWDYGNAFAIAENFDQQQEGFLWLVKNPDHNPAGDFALTDNGQVLSQINDAGWTFSGVSLLSPRLFTDLPEGVRPLAPVLRQAMERGTIHGQVLPCDWVDVGTPERLASLEQTLLRKIPG
ncbi:N-acetylmuramate alpha-1-phosphate uridylyltransferase MurU [Bacterioplanoides sp.]|uniref:N-acetylmuramate alpha-1-phosphate uridylyltransferase MurU n=1 Tax=Bacterioplanoides sp. TaxID=2066072 RepID=UPI003B5C492B